MDTWTSAVARTAEERWRARIDRAQLARRSPSAAELLGFYEKVLDFQLRLASRSNDELKLQSSLREQIKVESILPDFPALLSLAAEYGPPLLSEHARNLQRVGKAEHRQIIQQVVDSPESNGNAFDSFLARACLQPIAEQLQLQLSIEITQNANRCPACGGLPQLAVLRPEGEGASRSLVCSFCLREWLFRRLLCPWCGEEDKEKLPRFSTPECKHVLLEACDVCKKYLKAVDMSVDGNAEPLIDETALAVLDVWAADHGFEKICRNLLGF
jgi:FdhE protein